MGGPASRGRATGAAGFTLLGLLFLLVVLGLGLSAVATVWHTYAVREKETELLFLGDQFRRAIISYRTQAPAGVQEWPRTLDDLVQDDRWPDVRRHLRKVYPDPFTGKREWGLVMRGDRIIGVHSLSATKPRKTADFPPAYAQFASAETHADWRFVDEAGAVPPPQAGGPVVLPPEGESGSPNLPGAPSAPVPAPLIPEDQRNRGEVNCEYQRSFLLRNCQAVQRNSPTAYQACVDQVEATYQACRR
jgi:type II secretory pathway pseudopilin PulG